MNAKNLWGILTILCAIFSMVLIVQTNAYASVDDLTASPRLSINELAEVSAPDNAAIDGALLARYLKDDIGDVDDQTRADLAVAVDKINRSLQSATTEIDGRIQARYPVLDPVPGILKNYAVDIALYDLFGGDVESERYRRYKTALAYLDSVAAGRFDLPDSRPPDTVASEGVEFSNTTAHFTQDNLRGF